MRNIMTLGEKLKKVRKEAGLSQEQLAEKMCVSRSAIAKWEADKGMPDINNLKIMAKLLNVSIDYLLDDDEQISINKIKETININDYKKSGKCRDKRDAACLDKNKDADSINALIRQKKMSKAEAIIDFVVQPGIVDVLDKFNDTASYYIVEKQAKQYFVKVTNDFIETSELATKVDAKKFVIGDNQYKKLYQII